MRVQLLDYNLEKRGLSLDDLLKPERFRRLETRDQTLLCERRLINFTELQDFLRKCTYKDVEMLRYMYCESIPLKKKAYVTKRLAERLRALVNEVVRRELAV